MESSHAPGATGATTPAPGATTLGPTGIKNCRLLGDAQLLQPSRTNAAPSDFGHT